MMYLISILIAILVFVIVVQIGKVNELAARLRGEEQAYFDGNNWNARMMIIFMVLFLIGTVASAIYYLPYMLGYGPNILPTIHAPKIMSLFNTTLFFTGIVFIITHILLFYFAYKYREMKGRKAEFISHDNKLEIIWTGIPAVVMAILVVFGLSAWNETMADVDPDGTAVGPVVVGTGDIENGTKDYIEIGATGMQFSWILRHPGKDGKLGTKNWKLITGSNSLGQDFTDPKNIDDIILDELVLPLGHTVRARITSRDVLHNFDIPHFFVKMDAIPGMPTYFKFTPTMTTEAYREHLSQFPEWQVPDDPTEPDGLQRWEAFNFELACAELCGKSHYSMRKVVRVVAEEEYNAWLDEMEPTAIYLNEIRGTEQDPFLDRPTLQIEKRIKERAAKKDATKPAVPAPGLTPQPVDGATGSVNESNTGTTATSTSTTSINGAVNTAINNAAHSATTAVNNVENATVKVIEGAKAAGEHAIESAGNAADDAAAKAKAAADKAAEEAKRLLEQGKKKTEEVPSNPF